MGAGHLEANVVPVEGTARGRLVIDASVPYCHYDLILWHPTTEIDGILLMRTGELC
jgi:hypothetical protein